MMATKNETVTHAEIGCRLSEIDTPALCIDLNALEANIRRMAGLCKEHSVDWRPHSKGHKSPEIARRQFEAGAIGVTCAKLGEAEVMAAAGIRDILIANQLVGPHKMQRLAALCRVADPVVAVDHVDQVNAMSEATSAAGVQLRVIVEVDVGLARCGTSPGAATLELARHIHESRGLILAGIMGYEGHLLTVDDLSHKESSIRQAMGQLESTRDLLIANGLPCPIVSAGGTGSYAYTMDCPGVTELQAGGLIFMDVFYRDQCQVRGFAHALSIQASVVSRPTPERAIIDAGRKTMNMELELPEVIDREGIRVERLSAEHGQLTLDPVAQDLAIGDRITLIPGYGDFTSVLHNEFFAVRNGVVEAVWPIAARGLLR